MPQSRLTNGRHEVVFSLLEAMIFKSKYKEFKSKYNALKHALDQLKWLILLSNPNACTCVRAQSIVLLNRARARVQWKFRSRESVKKVPKRKPILVGQNYPITSPWRRSSWSLQRVPKGPNASAKRSPIHSTPSPTNWPSSMAMPCVAEYVDLRLLYQQIKGPRQERTRVINNWCITTCSRLDPLYQLLLCVLSTVISSWQWVTYRSSDTGKKGGICLGYQTACRNSFPGPIQFDYLVVNSWINDKTAHQAE